MNEQFIKDVTKRIKNTPLNQELAPGSVPRRYTPPGGEKRHRERIHKESKIADSRNLPFAFSKPPTSKRQSYFSCNNCGHIFPSSISTIGVICNECNHFSACSEIMENDEG